MQTTALSTDNPSARIVQTGYYSPHMVRTELRSNRRLTIPGRQRADRYIQPGLVERASIDLCRDDVQVVSVLPRPIAYDTENAACVFPPLKKSEGIGPPGIRAEL